MVMSNEWKELIAGFPRAPHPLQEGSVYWMTWFQPEPNFDSLAADVSPEYPEMRAGSLSLESQNSLKARRLKLRADVLGRKIEDISMRAQLLPRFWMGTRRVFQGEQPIGPEA